MDAYLQETLFTSHAGTFRSIRGREVRKGYGSFQLRNGVYALQRLFLSYALLQQDQTLKTEPGSETILLQGGRNSLAASLNYALNKPPKWLLDMFGCTADGSTYLQCILKRENSTLRQTENVRFMVRTNSLVDILIFINGRRTTQKKELESLLYCLPEDEIEQNSSHSPSLSDRFLDLNKLKNKIRNSFIQECRTAFTWNPILKNSFIKDTINELSGHTWYRPLTQNFDHLQQLNDDLPISLRLGTLDRSVISRELNKIGKVEIF